MKCKLYSVAFASLLTSHNNHGNVSGYRQRPLHDGHVKAAFVGLYPIQHDRASMCSSFGGSSNFVLSASPVDNVEDSNEKKPLKSLKHVSNIDVMPLKHVPKRKQSVTPLSEEDEATTDVPRLPSGEFRPKQSLGQNFISDKNIMNRLCNAFDMDEGGHPDGRQVIEVGAGIGSLTHILYEKYPKMTAIEIDARAISQLSRNIPNLDVIHDDVLQVDYDAVSRIKETKLWVIGNLPFYITSQILFCLVDYKRVIDLAVVTAQLEVAKRIVAKPCDFDYSILSVVMQLYSKPKLLFKIPSHAFYPVPKVESGVLRLDFRNTPNPKCAPLVLKRVLRDSFNQRRKMLKTSLRTLLDQLQITRLPPELEDVRPQHLSPEGFVALALWIQKNGKFKSGKENYDIHDNRRMLAPLGTGDLQPNPKRVWRQEHHGEE